MQKLMIATHIILFDEVCYLCNSSVQFIMTHDKKKLFRFAPIHSQAGHKLLSAGGVMPDTIQSVVYIKNGRYYLNSDAALQVALTLGGIWSLFYVLIIVPKSLRDWAYSIIAKKRYKWFGKKNICVMMTPELRNRLL